MSQVVTNRLKLLDVTNIMARGQWMNEIYYLVP